MRKSIWSFSKTFIVKRGLSDNVGYDTVYVVYLSAIWQLK